MARVDVPMPQMGESIAEGTVSKWLKKPGDKVERDEPLLEISTDKVDAEIPSPAAGTLAEILVNEGQTVPVNSVVARISAEGEASAPKPQPAAAAPAPAPKPTPAPAPAAPQPPPQQQQQRAANAAMQQEVKQEATGAAPASIPQPAGAPPAWAAPKEALKQGQQQNVTSLDERRRTKSSPLVRKIARENDI